MKQIAAAFACASALALAAAAPAAGADDRIDQQLKDIEFCYAISVLGASTVQLRSQGQTLDEQLAKRKAALDEPQYALIADLTRQVYDKDLTDPFVVAGDTNAACLHARGQQRAFAPAGQKYCPRVGLMVSEVDRLRRAGGSAEDVVKALEGRYGSVRTALGETLAQVAAKPPKGDAPETGALDHKMCMILAITGG